MSNPNFMEDIAHKLGLELGQKFCVRHYRGHLLNDWQTEAILIFMFTKDNGMVAINTENNMYQANTYLADLILGRYQIVPYKEGCEIPKKDPELKKIYEYWDNIHGELHGYLTENWLNNKKLFLTSQEKTERYTQLYTTLKDTDYQLEHILSLPIFEEFNKKK